MARAFCRLDTGQQFSGKFPDGQGLGTLQQGGQAILGQYFNAVAGQNADVTEPEPKWLVSAVDQGDRPARECGAQQAPAGSVITSSRVNSPVLTGVIGTEAQ